ncbi:Tetratricopeptide repeat protein 8 [Blyttiomyces sp. JEL0837]|nr:Tetratricopeptide repeat protein 8 [Blyttiomyces sp. JEL0837]
MQNAYRLFTVKAYDECQSACSEILEKNPYDQAAWLLKVRALSELSRQGDIDLEFLNIADAFLDDESSNTALPRPNTSIDKKAAQAKISSQDPAAALSTGKSVRPTSAGGRITTGYLRPTTALREMGKMNARAALATSSGHLVSSSGRLVRLGTASLLTEEGGPFINIDKLDLKKYAAKSVLARGLFEYIYSNLQNNRKALELASHATQINEYHDWWWKLQIGKCFMQLRMHLDAEKHLKSSLKEKDQLSTRMYLCKNLLLVGQSTAALELLAETHEKYPHDPSSLIFMARIYEQAGDMERCNRVYKLVSPFCFVEAYKVSLTPFKNKVLELDPSNVEALASIASNYFYDGQPELAHRYYRRLLQLGHSETAELWNNLGLCAFFSQQYDLAIPCFEKALQLALDDKCLADIWYNIAHVGIQLGDFTMAYQALKVAVATDNNHAEAWNNLAIVEFKLNKDATACNHHFERSAKISPFLYEPFYNMALVAMSKGNVESGYENVKSSLKNYPGHRGSQDLQEKMVDMLSS